MLIESQNEKISDLNRDLIAAKLDSKRLLERGVGGDDFHMRELDRLTKDLQEARNEVDRLLKIIQSVEKEKENLNMQIKDLEKYVLFVIQNFVYLKLQLFSNLPQEKIRMVSFYVVLSVYCTNIIVCSNSNTNFFLNFFAGKLMTRKQNSQMSSKCQR